MSDLRQAAPVGFILAAGYGTRLQPVTDHVPKPLLPVGERTLLDRAAAALLDAGCETVGVNTHHLAPLISDHLAAHERADRFLVFFEPEILGTGGALDGARALLETAPAILLHNGDVICDANLRQLLDEHTRSGALATLLLADCERFNTVVLTAGGAISDIAGLAGASEQPNDRRLTYTGIAALDARLLTDIAPGFSSLIAPLVQALQSEPGCVRGWAPDGLGWDDLGTLPRYLAAIERHGIGDGTALQVEPIIGHGSDRRFWRLRAGDWSAVAMVSPPQDEEFARYLAIGRFLHTQKLGAPAILSEDAGAKTVLVEDLGPHRLLEKVQQTNHPDALYEPVIDHLLRLQQATEDARRNCPEAVDRVLDHSVLRWETDYFRERFLAGHCGLEMANLAHLTPEFEALAGVVARQPQVLLHRDFQSQNIIMTPNGPGLVDFQGLRLGPLGYDVMSLLCDPYVNLDRALIDRLLHRFSAAQDDPPACVAMAVAAGLQRVMQALGAYGFLGHVKGKTAFLAHIPRALANLRWLLEQQAGLLAQDDPDQTVWLPPRLEGLEAVLDTLD